MLFGGAIIVFAFGIFTQHTPFQFGIFLKWGIILSLFGTIIPPMLMNAGFPFTGIGLGSIVSALELPISVLMAYFLLHEEVVLLQWLGILLIILAMQTFHHYILLLRVTRLVLGLLMLTFRVRTQVNF